MVWVMLPSAPCGIKENVMLHDPNHCISSAIWASLWTPWTTLRIPRTIFVSLTWFILILQEKIFVQIHTLATKWFLLSTARFSGYNLVYNLTFWLSRHKLIPQELSDKLAGQVYNFIGFLDPLNCLTLLLLLMRSRRLFAWLFDNLNLNTKKRIPLQYMYQHLSQNVRSLSNELG